MEPVTFVFVGSMVAEKGVYEYIRAAKTVQEKHPETKFIMIGSMDQTASNSLSESYMNSLISSGLITYVGEVNDVVPWLDKSSVFVLPSYREGLPHSTQEAMAVGRAVITTDAPGCRETVVDGVNGFIVPPFDGVALSRAMLKFLKNQDLIVRIGLESRRMAREKYDVHRVNEQMLKAMGLI